MKDQLHKVYLKKKAAVKAAFSFALKGEPNFKLEDKNVMVYNYS